MPVLQRDAVLRSCRSTADPGGGRRRWLRLLSIAATLACGSSLAVAPAAGAAQGQAFHPYTGPATRAGRTARPAPRGPSATPPAAKQAIPLRTPDPGKLRRAKERAASRVSGGAGPSPRALSPLPKASVFGGLNKPGMAADEFSGTPPDTTGAIGPSNYLEFVNSIGITAYDRELTAVAGPVALEDFIGYPSDFVFDPQIQWDEDWGRWVYAMDDIEGPGANYLAFGWSKTADPTDLSTEEPVPGGEGAGWCSYFIFTGEFFDDYPKLGHSDSGLTLGTNVFNESDEFLGSRLWSIAKPASPETCPEESEFSIASAAPLVTEDGDFAFTPVPANTADSSANSYVVAADYPGIEPEHQIMGWHIEGAGSGATLFEDGNMEVSTYDFPANVPQPGTSQVIDSLDARLTNAVAVTDPAVGEEAVWTQHTVDGPGGRSVVRWYELLPDTQTVRQEGTISDSEQFVFNGAISPTAQGNAAAIDFNRASATLSPDMHAQSRESETPLGEMEGDVLLGTSAGPAVDFSCDIAEFEPCRWGDYAGASPDPVEAGIVWGSNQGLAATLASPHDEDARWTTRNFALLAGEAGPAAPTITATDPASPASDNEPKVKGTAEASSTVRIYKSSNCSGPVAAEGSAAAFASPGLTVTVPDDTTTQLSATATDAAENTSPCSAPFAYTEDSTGPAAPTITATEPASPADDNEPKVKGTAEASSTVRVYKSSDCSGPVPAEGSAAAFASPGLTVTVPDDTTTQLSATATDAAENTSPCSSPFAYTEEAPEEEGEGGGGGSGGGGSGGGAGGGGAGGGGAGQPGTATAAAVAQVKGGKALLKLTCLGAGACRGTLKFVIRVKAVKGKGAKLSKKRTRKLTIGRAGFAIPASRTKTIRAPLTGKGKRLLRGAGRRGVKVKLRGSGVRSRTVRLREARKGHAAR